MAYFIRISLLRLFKTLPISNTLTSTLTYATRSSPSGRELDIPVPWGHIAAKEWGDRGGRPVLALHGMGDNLASFERLAPLLPRYWHLVAIDFPGFGQSPSLPEGSFPSLITMVADVKRVVRHLGWNKCDIIGHCFGGGVALLYAALFTENIGRVVSLDPVKFLCGPASLVRHLLADRIQDLLDLEAAKVKECFILRPLDVAVQQSIAKWSNSLTKESAALLVKRGMKLSKNNSTKYPSTSSTTIPSTNSSNALSGNSENILNDFKNSHTKKTTNSSEKNVKMSSSKNNEIESNIDSSNKVKVDFINESLSEAKIALNSDTNDHLQLVATSNTDWHKLMAFQEFTVDQGLVLAQVLAKNVEMMIIQSNWVTPKWYTSMESFPFADFINVLGKYGRLRRVVVEGTHHAHMNRPETVLPHIVEFFNEANIDYRSIKPCSH